MIGNKLIITITWLQLNFFKTWFRNTDCACLHDPIFGICSYCSNVIYTNQMNQARRNIIFHMQELSTVNLLHNLKDLQYGIQLKMI